jgi:hypothetical protein
VWAARVLRAAHIKAHSVEGLLGRCPGFRRSKPGARTVTDDGTAKAWIIRSQTARRTSRRGLFLDLCDDVGELDAIEQPIPFQAIE